MEESGVLTSSVARVGLSKGNRPTLGEVLKELDRYTIVTRLLDQQTDSLLSQRKVTKRGRTRSGDGNRGIAYHSTRESNQCGGISAAR